MSHLNANGELSPARLAQDILSLSCFHLIDPEDYRILLRSMVATEHLQRTECGGLIIGRLGEKVVNLFSFYAVFEVPEYYLVKDENRSIGTVDKVYPEGVRFSLAGMTWETVEVNRKAKVLFVKRVPGISTVDWDVDFESELHTKLVRKIREILLRDERYPYLSESCQARLAEIRSIARGSMILTTPVTPLSDRKYAVFPWVGTRQLYTLHYALLTRGIHSRIPWRTSVYLEVLCPEGAGFLRHAIEDILKNPPDPDELLLPDDIQIRYKYNEYVPNSLLKKQFVQDFLDFHSLVKDFL